MSAEGDISGLAGGSTAPTSWDKFLSSAMTLQGQQTWGLSNSVDVTITKGALPAPRDRETGGLVIET